MGGLEGDGHLVAIVQTEHPRLWVEVNLCGEGGRGRGRGREEEREGGREGEREGGREGGGEGGGGRRKGREGKVRAQKMLTMKVEREIKHTRRVLVNSSR